MVSAKNLELSTANGYHSIVEPRIAHIAVTPEVLKKLDLSESAFGEDLLAKDVGDFFDCDAFAGLIIRRSAVNSKR